MAKLKLKKPYFYSKERKRFGQVLSDDTKRIVYTTEQSRNGPYNKAMYQFNAIYPDANFLTEQEYLFLKLKYD